MKKLNIAFIWHFHQPNYQEYINTDFLLPWVRLHAAKDYLDMLKRIDKFPNLKLNFNFSPVLLSALQRYALGAQDLHLKVLLKDEKKLTETDKVFILNNYFDLNYKNMVLKRPYFTELYNKRVNSKEIDTKIFTLQEYVDVMANFTLCWVDEYFVQDYPDLAELFAKEKNYTLDDRNRIYEIQLDIIKRILVEYKNYQDNNRIEVSISPYYHPILPLLLNFKNKEIKNFENLPSDFSDYEDFKTQIKRAIEKYTEIFERKPNGMWLSEQCVCAKTAEQLSKMGIKWTVLDEGILSKSSKKEFARDFEGNLENPFELNVNYKTKNKNPINLLFADSFFANLLNFGYGNYDPMAAANDMYDKIKTIQFKLQNSPRENHILTIALDGENCWETYQNDGGEFLDILYKLIDEDESLETVLVNDFIESSKPETLETLKAGSWINRNFDLWIGEPTKNVAWLYLYSVNKDFKEYQKAQLKKVKTKKEKELLQEKLFLAHRELLVAQGSDWYWWYGEPNESKNDNVFDYLFRNHLMNVYRFLNLEVPQYLYMSLTNLMDSPLRDPKSKITPSLCCDPLDKDDEWANAGCIFVPDGPTTNIGRLIKNIYFGNDSEYLYFRFEVNRASSLLLNKDAENQIAIYISVVETTHYSPIRFVSKNDNIYPITKNQFSYEIRFVFDAHKTSHLYISQAIGFGLWTRISSKKSKIAYNEVIELKVALSDIKHAQGDISFFVIDSTNEFINEVHPQDVLIDLKID